MPEWPEWVDGEGRGPSRRSVPRTAGALLPGPVLGVGARGTASAASGPSGSTADDQRVPRTLAQRGGYTGPVEGAVDVNGWQVCSSRSAATAPRTRRTACSATYSRAVVQGCPRGSGYSGLIGEVPDTHACRALGDLVS